MGTLISLKKRLLSWFIGLTTRERTIVAVAALGLISYFSYLPVVAAQTKIKETKDLIRRRGDDFQGLEIVLKRYNLLNAKLARLQATFNDLPKSFEPATKELDEIIKNSIGSDSYELTKVRAPAPFGEKYEKQNYTLSIKEIPLEQLTKLLFAIDRSKNSIFTANVEILSSQAVGRFRLTLDVITVRKKPN